MTTCPLVVFYVVVVVESLSLAVGSWFRLGKEERWLLIQGSETGPGFVTSHLSGPVSPTSNTGYHQVFKDCSLQTKMVQKSIKVYIRNSLLYTET